MGNPALDIEHNKVEPPTILKYENPAQEKFGQDINHHEQKQSGKEFSSTKKSENLDQIADGNFCTMHQLSRSCGSNSPFSRRKNIHDRNNEQSNSSININNFVEKESPSRICFKNQIPLEKEMRKKVRVERKLQELDKNNDETEHERHYDMVEFATNHFNNHERFPEGTIISTLSRRSRDNKNLELIPKYEMVTFSKCPTIPISHIILYDPDNVNIACSIFRVS